MTYNSTIALDQISESQSAKATTANALFSAMSPAALWGIKASVTSGLSFGLYGGVMNIAGVPTVKTSQTVTLTASTTNYIYATSAGVVTKTTSIPAGWPGPLATGAIALYQLVVGSASITSGIKYVTGTGSQGATGIEGAQGPAGTELAASRKRLWQPIGGGSTTLTYWGFSPVTLVGTGTTARTLASSSLRESIPYVGYPTAAGAGSSAQVYPANNWCYLGNAAGRGGFTFSMRFCFESASSPAQQRCFFGLFDKVTGSFANAEPDTFINIIGVGAKAAEANLSLLYNDGSGTATKTLINSDGSPTVNFPARATDNVYEFTMTTVANSGIVSYSLTNINTGDIATGTISSNLPSNTTFLTWVAWINNGTTASSAAMGIMQVVGEARY
jgi:hypothetical protein